MRSLLLLVSFALLTSSQEIAAQSFSDELMNGVRGMWSSVEQANRAGDVWRDKKHFNHTYVNLTEGRALSKEDLKEALEAFDVYARRFRKNKHFIWRAHDLRSSILWDMGDERKSFKELKAAMQAYPDEKYSLPHRHSSFQHLANLMAERIWDTKGVEEAEKEIFALFRKEDRFHFFWYVWWIDRYNEKGLPERTAPLVDKVVEIYRMKAKRSGYYRKQYEEFAADIEANVALKLEAMGNLKYVDNNPRMAYYLLLPSDSKPADERDLILVLPGGHGQAADFLPWAKKLHANAASEAVFAVLSAPQWTSKQAKNHVWPTANSRDRFPEAEFTTEKFIRSTLNDIVSNKTFKLRKAFVFGWSSSGPAVYAAALSKDAPYDGYYILASVFKPDTLDLAYAKGRRFFLQQGEEDRVTALRWATQAERDLRNNGAIVKLDIYDGGHGFDMPDAFKSVRDAFAWLNSNGD